MVPSRRSFLFLLVAFSLLDNVLGQLQDPCYVCRSPDRKVVNLSHQFTMKNIYDENETWTCGGLEDWAEENLKVSNTVCGISIAWAERECVCNGPPIPPVTVIDTNPACNICITNGVGVPIQLIEELVDTGVAGQFPCGFLYTISASGGMPGYLCPEIQANVAEFCCTIPVIVEAPTDPPTDPPTIPPTDPPTEKLCAALSEVCDDSANPCCPQYDCKERFVNAPPVCSARRRVFRTRISTGLGLGGAAGRARVSN
jgi:hypothetical protein